MIGWGVDNRLTNGENAWIRGRARRDFWTDAGWIADRNRYAWQLHDPQLPVPQPVGLSHPPSPPHPP